MRLGLNIPFVALSDNSFIDIFSKTIYEKLELTGVLDLRIPFLWNLLQKLEGGKVIWNESELDNLSLQMSKLPKEARILGCFINVPQEVAEEYFHDQSSLSGRIDEFAKGIANRFPTIREWEIWNEPNANNFYLSIGSGESHRPWLPREYLYSVLIPGAKAIKAVNPDAKLCIGGVAENGIVGHPEKEPPISNQLLGIAGFAKFRSNKPHSHFYFIPDFGPSLWKELEEYSAESKRKGERQLFQAIAFHPYPYFKIHARKNPSLLESSLEMCEDFFNSLNGLDIGDMECWATEVGSRSLDLLARNYHDEQQQDEFLKKLVDSEVSHNDLDRMYWYKFIDTDRDLRREKTFGLLDHTGQEKKSYFTFCNLLLRQKVQSKILFETFSWALKHGKGAFNPDFWEESFSSHHAYMTLGRSSNCEPFASVFPGRMIGDWAQIASRAPLHISEGGFLDINVGFQLPQTHEQFSFRIFAGTSNNSRDILEVELCNLQNDELRLSFPQGKKSFTTRRSDYSFASAKRLTGIRVQLWCRQLSVILVFGSVYLVKVTELNHSFENTDAFIGIRTTLLRHGTLSVINLKDVKASTHLPANVDENHPREIAVPAEHFTFLSPKYSQIGQDEWVLRATGFKESGFFIEIGAHDGVSNSNTFLLERDFAWRGIIVEANPRWYREACKNRLSIAVNAAVSTESGKKLDFVDAGAVGCLLSQLQSDTHLTYRQKHIDAGAIIKVPSIRCDEILGLYNAPELIDYISIDTEGSEIDVLRSMDFSRWRVCLLSVEHCGIEEKRAEMLSFLTPYGFERIRVWFEDWFFNIEHLASQLGLSKEQAKRRIELANSFIPVIRGHSIVQAGFHARKSGNRKLALELFKEGTKTFYPNNNHACLEVAEEMDQLGFTENAIQYLLKLAEERKGNPAVLRRSIMIFVRRGRLVLLVRALNKLLMSQVDVMKDKQLMGVLRICKDKVLSLFEQNQRFRDEYQDAFRLISTLE